MANNGMNARAFERFTVSINKIICAIFTSVTTRPYIRENTLHQSDTETSWNPGRRVRCRDLG